MNFLTGVFVAKVLPCIVYRRLRNGPKLEKSSNEDSSCVYSVSVLEVGYVSCNTRLASRSLKTTRKTLTRTPDPAEQMVAAAAAVTGATAMLEE